MKYVYIVKSKLHFYPPCISHIRMIKKLGYDIEVLYGTSDNNILKTLKSEGINCKKVSDIKDEYIGKFNKLKGWLKFRKALNKEIKKYDKQDTIFWFGTAETVIPMKGLLKGKRYIVTLLELLDESTFKRKLLHGIIENAYKVTCCEETRAHIIKYWYHLNELPTVFPNKPYDQIAGKRVKPTNKITSKIIEEIKDEDIILYQGYIQNTEELCEIAKALKENKKKYKFVLMGMDKYNSYRKVKEIYNNTVFYPYIPAPLHLEVTSYAKIGILFYRPTILNNAFCAPNKIFEYSGYGIPMLGNDIPGLKNTIGVSGAGECVELTKEKIKEAIDRIEKNYNEYSEKSLKYYNSINNLETMRRFLK